MERPVNITEINSDVLHLRLEIDELNNIDLDKNDVDFTW